MGQENLKSAIVRLRGGLPSGTDDGIFGANIAPEESQILLLGVPWDGTASYHKGTAQGPKSICLASHQLDFEDRQYGPVYERGISYIPPSNALLNACQNKSQSLEETNKTSKQITIDTYQTCLHWLNKGKTLGLIGGEHSVSLGLLKALSEYDASPFSILHIDAHLDLRDAYEGYHESHASVMYNVAQEISSVDKFVHVGIRDYSKDEERYTNDHSDRHTVFFDQDIYNRKAQGETFDQIAQDIISGLSDRVYISFDIDGLDPKYCPNTGTPVPGGVSFHEASYILNLLHKSNKKVIGFDLVEVVPGHREWDENVGARMLYKLCGAAAYSK